LLRPAETQIFEVPFQLFGVVIDQGDWALDLWEGYLMRAGKV
jgi:hypothetical protein